VTGLDEDTMPQPRTDISDSGVGTETASLATLDAAVALAKDGNYLSARRLCATVVFHSQPSISADPKLLRATVFTLLVAHGFRLLSRVVMSINGRRVDVTMMPDCIGEVMQPRLHDEPRRIAMLVDPRWLGRLQPDDGFLRDWCDRLTAGTRTEIGFGSRSVNAREVLPVSTSLN
jgi:hypothetical protein